MVNIWLKRWRRYLEEAAPLFLFFFLLPHAFVDESTNESIGFLETKAKRELFSFWDVLIETSGYAEYLFLYSSFLNKTGIFHTLRILISETWYDYLRSKFDEYAYARYKLPDYFQKPKGKM